MRARGTALVAVVSLVSAPAFAQPAGSGEVRRPENGYIGQAIPDLEVDHCRTPPDGTTAADRTRIGEEHYHRGETLYTQGDYKGAVLELVDSYCLVGYYTILKDIGQAYERDLGYAQAIAYFERYVRDMPDNAQRTSTCAVDPQVDRENVRGRIQVLSTLKANVVVESDPVGATVTVSTDAVTVSRSVAGAPLPITLTSGTYDMVVEAPKHIPQHKTITVEIGKPYTYFFALKAQTGRLSVQVTPSDARVFLGNRFIGVGRVDVDVESDNYTLSVEAPDRVSIERSIAVLPNQVNNVHVEMPAKAQDGRTQLFAAATIGGGTALGMIGDVTGEAELVLLGVGGGVAAGLLGSYLAMPATVPLGTSNLTITASLIGGFAGGAIGLLGTAKPTIWVPLSGAAILVGAASGYYFGERTHVGTGDAAIVNTGALWGGIAGGLFTQSFGADRKIGAGLVLSGLALGTIGGSLAASYFNVRRTHAALIDLGGVVGLIGGLAAVRVAYGANESTARGDEHTADFMLGGMAVGLIGAGVLTRHLDSPKIPVAPTLGATRDVGGTSHLTIGLGGTW